MFRQIFWVLALMGIMLGVTLHETDVKYGEERNIYNYTSNKFIWNNTYFEGTEINNIENLDINSTFANRFHNIIFKTVDLVGYTFFQFLNFTIEFGYEKFYDYDTESFVFIAKLIFIILILSLVIPIIVPVLALCYLLFESFKWLINKIKDSRVKK